MAQKEFYGSFESRKLSFFAIQMGAGLFDWVLDHSGRRTPLYHLSELQAVGIALAVIAHTADSLNRVTGARFLMHSLENGLSLFCLFNNKDCLR